MFHAIATIVEASQGLDKAEKIVAITAGVLAIIGAFYAFIKIAWYVFKKLLLIEEVLKEFKPNCGSSMRDAIDRIEVETKQQTIKIDSVNRKTERHEQVLWNLIQDSRCGVFETDENGKFIKVNQTYLRMLGVSQEDCLGNNWINQIAEEDRQRVALLWDDVVARNRAVETTMRMAHSDGHKFTVTFRARPMLITMTGIKSDKMVSGWTGSITVIMTAPAEEKPQP